MAKKKTPLTLCPCGSGRPYSDCCAPLINGSCPADSAEALMRSRFTAYATAAHDYLLASWHPSTRPQDWDNEDVSLKWLNLEVHEHQKQDDDHATVRFTATGKVSGRLIRIQETSRFVRENGDWYYLDGDIENS